jgi:UDP-GlcNAc:undecaprenyl-phosphate/decaprenyl-phosphate GlcNAc-1-phosphate transferase
MHFNFSLEILYKITTEITISLILALFFGPVAIFIAKKLGVIDVPGSAAHKRHAGPTPLAGGLVLFLALPILAIIFQLWDDPGIFWLLAATGVVFIFGLMDDIHGLSAPQKFVGQFMAASIVILSGTSVKFLENFYPGLAPWLVDILHWLITLFWLIGISNAFNLIDSMDGLVAGLAAISAGFFTLTCLASGQTELAQLAAILFGLSLGLYFYNNAPARFFLGDSGAQALGFLLAVIGILYTPQQVPQGSTWFVPILMLGVPIFDTTLVVVSRIRRRRPVFTADLAHTYHRLVHLGMSPGQAVLTIQITALLLCNIAFIAMSLAPHFAFLLFLIVILLGAGLIFFFEKAVKIKV